ncbi:MAG TPA: DUF222 domain-containing protein [Micromonosporaceae bacterium]
METVHAEAGVLAADKAVGLLLDWAGQFDPDSLRKLADRILDHVAPQVAEQAQRRALEAAEKRDQRDRYLNLSPQPDGRVRLSALLDVETSTVLRTAFGPLTKPHGEQDDRTPGQRRHDALTEVCRLALRTGKLPDNGGGEATQVVVTTGYDPLAGQLGAGTLDTGEQISAESVRRLACDASILPAVLGSQGQVLDIGRQRRLFTGPIRRALVLRDRGCAFPGCDPATPLVQRASHHPLVNRRHHLPGQWGVAVRAAPPSRAPRRLAGPYRRRRAPRVHPTHVHRPATGASPQHLPPTLLIATEGDHHG